MSFSDKLKHQAEEATVAGADAAGAFDPPIDEEEVAEEVLSADLDPRRPSTLPRKQRLDCRVRAPSVPTTRPESRSTTCRSSPTHPTCPAPARGAGDPTEDCG